MRWFLWALVLLHTPTGQEIWVRPDDVVFIGPATVIAPKKAGAAIIVHDREFFVRESVEEVVNAVR